ncbi:MAG TPA: hypothetical protein VJ793_24745 [Anaerolineae bacterium]|nr:hypothetical protein [Anaerolineae bacterium]
MNRLSKALAVLLLASVVLSACGGGGAGDPTATVKSMIQAIQDKKFDSLPDYVCAEKKDELTQQLDFRSSLGGLGFDAQKLIDAMTFDLSSIQYTKVSESGDNAVVKIEGDMKMKVDRDKIKDLIVELLKAQGIAQVTDDMVNSTLDIMAAQLESGIDMSADVELVKEGGAWKVCSDIGP